jgi:hypothetical protein
MNPLSCHLRFDIAGRLLTTHKTIGLRVKERRFVTLNAYLPIRIIQEELGFRPNRSRHLDLRMGIEELV